MFLCIDMTKKVEIKQNKTNKHFLCCIFVPLQESQMPKDLEETCQVTYAVLSNPNTRPVIIIIDALNQVTCYIIHRGPFRPKAINRSNL